MEFRESFIKGVFEITPRIFEDERGIFFEAYQEKIFREKGINLAFVQDNQSLSKKNVLRGLHLQKPPFAQDKLVYVPFGSVIDVVVDMRPDSLTFGKYDTFLVDDKKHNRVFVPAGMAHGFITLTEAVFAYKCSNFYHKESESGLLWNDKKLNIDWGNKNPIISGKDLELPTFEQFMNENF